MQSLINAYTSAWQRSFAYEGRSSRPDYWWFVLANFIVAFVLQVIGMANGVLANIANLYLVAQIVPHLPLTIRRLRDSGKPWPWFLIGLIPLIGGIWLIVLLCQPSLQALA